MFPVVGEVVIRTNSANTTLTINAEHDTVNHYGSVGRVDAQKIDMNCYNEYGKAAYIKVTEGKVVAKAGGTIEVVFAANNDKDAVAVIKENQGTIEKGLTVIQPVSDTNEARTNGIPLEYSVNGETAATKTPEQLATELETREAAVEVIAVDVIETAVEKEAVEADESDFWIVCHADAFAAGSGTELDPYIIKTARQLSLLAYNVNTSVAGNYATAYYRLDKDIDLSGKAWTPIGITSGTNVISFLGHFDGNNHSIIGLTNNDKTDVDLGLFRDELSSVPGLAARGYGLFGFTKNVNISNLTMESAKISGLDHFNESGIIIGKALGSTTMTNCTIDSESSIIGKSKIGGFVGIFDTYDDGGNVHIDNCDFAGSVTVKDNRAGAIAGAMTFHNGVTQYNAGHTHLLKDCDSTGTINSGSYGTGLIGFAYQGTATYSGYGIKTITFDNCIVDTSKFTTTGHVAKYIGRLDSYTTAVIIKNDSYATNIIGDLSSGASLILKVGDNYYGYSNNGGTDLLPSLTGNEETYKLGQMISNNPGSEHIECWKTDRIVKNVPKDTLFKIDSTSIDLSTGELKYGAGWYDIKLELEDFSSLVASGYHIVVPETHATYNSSGTHYIYQIVAD